MEKKKKKKKKRKRRKKEKKKKKKKKKNKNKRTNRKMNKHIWKTIFMGKKTKTSEEFFARAIRHCGIVITLEGDIFKLYERLFVLMS